MTLALLGNTLLRTAITRNLVGFPAQVRPFMKRASGDLQERIVLPGKAMAHKLPAEWRIRAIESGCLQEIGPGNLARLENAATDTHAVNIREAIVNGIHPGMPVNMPAALNAPEPAIPRKFDCVNAASIPAVENPPVLSAGNGG